MASEDFCHNTCSYIDPWGVPASFDPMGLIGRIYVDDYLTLPHIKYISCGPNSFRREEDFQTFSQVISLWELYVSPYLMNLYMKFHHIWLTDIRDKLLSKCKWMMSDARPLPY